MAAGEMSSQFHNLPTEIILYLFTFLPAKELAKTRQVCQRFKQTIDVLSRSDSLWKRYCREEFPGVYAMARAKAGPGLLWYHVYRSLTLWPRLDAAREIKDEFAAANSVNEEIKNCEILKDGIVGVHKRSKIIYYDIDTLQQAKRCPITGDYSRYTENDTMLVILSYHLQLYIIQKTIQNFRIEPKVTYDSVKAFLLVNKELYFVNLNDEIFVCKVEPEQIINKLIKRSEDGVMCLGYTNKLHVLTFERNIYTVVDDKLEFTLSLGPDTNLLHQLRQYNFLEQLDWRVYFQWMFAFNHYIPEGPLRDIVSVRAYGDVYFIGSNWGVLRIYYQPYSAGQFDIFNAQPVKQYNFMERYDCPVLSMCPIIQIDVMEIEDGHNVIIAMPKKIAIIKFTHNFKRTASVAMLPYSDVQKVKILKING